MSPGSWLGVRGRALMVLMCAIGLSGCASGKRDPSLMLTEDMGASDMATVEDMAVADMPIDQGVADMGQDMPEDMNTCPVCCAGESMCQDGQTRLVCNDTGTGFDPVACGGEEICDAGTGACAPKPVCTPGQAMCVDSLTQLVCRASGTGYSTVSCPASTSCVDGQCVSGNVNGQSCAVGADCAGGKCQCGDEEGCPASLSPAYCTSACADSSACASDEWCLDASARHVNAAGADYDHCVSRCSTGCDVSGMSCRFAPIVDESGQPGWGRACVWDALKAVGEACTADAQCVGGRCLLGYYNTGVCTSPCETQGCPEDAACVLINDEYLCSPLCGTGSIAGTESCPFDPDDSRFDVTCAPKSTYGGGARRVCVRT